MKQNFQRSYYKNITLEIIQQSALLRVVKSGLLINNHSKLSILKNFYIADCEWKIFLKDTISAKFDNIFVKTNAQKTSGMYTVVCNYKNHATPKKELNLSKWDAS